MAELLKESAILDYIYDDLEDVIYSREDEPKNENDPDKRDTENVEENEEIQANTQTLDQLRKENELLRTRISELYKTAKVELNRKYNTISELTRKLDDLILKRNNRFMPSEIGHKRQRSSSPKSDYNCKKPKSADINRYKKDYSKRSGNTTLHSQRPTPSSSDHYYNKYGFEPHSKSQDDKQTREIFIPAPQQKCDVLIDEDKYKDKFIKLENRNISRLNKNISCSKKGYERDLMVGLKSRNKMEDIQEYTKKVKDDNFRGKLTEDENGSITSDNRLKNNREVSKKIKGNDDKNTIQNSKTYKKICEEKGECENKFSSRESKEGKREKAIDYKDDKSRSKFLGSDVSFKSYYDRDEARKQNEKVRKFNSTEFQSRSNHNRNRLCSANGKSGDSVEKCKKSRSELLERQIGFKKIDKIKADDKSRSRGNNKSKKELKIPKDEKDDLPKRNNILTTLKKKNVHQDSDNDSDLDLLILQDFKVIEEDFAEENKCTSNNTSRSNDKKRNAEKDKIQNNDKTISVLKRTSYEKSICQADRKNKKEIHSNTSEPVTLQGFNEVCSKRQKSKSRDKDIKYSKSDDKKNKAEHDPLTENYNSERHFQGFTPLKKNTLQDNKNKTEKCSKIYDMENSNKIDSNIDYNNPSVVKTLEDFGKVKGVSVIPSVHNDSMTSEDIISLEQKRQTLLEQLELEVVDDLKSVASIDANGEKKKIDIISDILLSNPLKNSDRNMERQMSSEKMLEAVGLDIEPKQIDEVDANQLQCFGEGNTEIVKSNVIEEEIKGVQIKEDTINPEETISKEHSSNSGFDFAQEKHLEAIILQKDPHRLSDHAISVQASNGNRSVKFEPCLPEERSKFSDDYHPKVINFESKEKDIISEAKLQNQLDVGVSEALLSDDFNKIDENIKQDDDTTIKLKRGFPQSSESHGEGNQNEGNDGSNGKDLEGSSSHISCSNQNISEKCSMIQLKVAKHLTLYDERNKTTINANESEHSGETKSVPLLEPRDESNKKNSVSNLLDSSSVPCDNVKQMPNTEMDEDNDTNITEGVVQITMDIVKPTEEKTAPNKEIVVYRHGLSTPQYNDLLEQLELSCDSTAEQSKSLECNTEIQNDQTKEKHHEEEHSAIIRQIVNEVAHKMYKPSLKSEKSLNNKVPKENVKKEKTRPLTKKKSAPKSKSLFPTIRLGRPNKKNSRSKVVKDQKEKYDAVSQKESALSDQGESDKETPTSCPNTPTKNKVTAQNSGQVNNTPVVVLKQIRVSRGKSMTRLKAMYKMENSKEDVETTSGESSLETKSPAVISSTLTPRGRNRLNRNSEKNVINVSQKMMTTPKMRRNSLRSCRMSESLSECLSEPLKSIKSRRKSAMEKNVKQEATDERNSNVKDESAEGIISSPLATFENMLEQSSKSAKNSPISKMNIEDMPIIHIEEGALGDVISLQNNTLLNLVDIANINANILSGKETEREEENMLNFTKYLSANKATSTPFKKSSTQKCIDFQEMKEYVVQLHKVENIITGNKSLNHSADAVSVDTTVSSEKQQALTKLRKSDMNSSDDSTKKANFTFGIPIRRIRKRPRVVLMEE